MKVECQERNGEGNGRERKELKVEGKERKGKERKEERGTRNEEMEENAKYVRHFEKNYPPYLELSFS